MAKLIKEHLHLKLMFTMLQKEALSKKQLTERLGLTNVTVCRWVETFCARPHNFLYISTWKRPATVGPYTALYSFGYCQEDAPRLKPISKAESSTRTRKKALKPEIILTSKGLTHVSH